MIDQHFAEIGLTVFGTMASTLIGVGKWFNSTISKLTISINELDKTMAVHAALIDQILKKGGLS